MSDLIIVDQLAKTFHHEGRPIHVLREVSFSLQAGEMLCVMGASGAGKSTLLHLLGTLDRPSSGTVHYANTDITRLSERKLASFRNQRIGFVFQFHHLLPEFTALENVMMPGRIAGQSGKELRQRAENLLVEVNLSERLHHRPGELSGGEQQRVALARALINQPQLILADEPTGNLDSRTSDAIHTLFFQLNERFNTTFLIVTHSRDLAARMPRVITMQDGGILRDHRQDEQASAQNAAQ